MHATGIASPAAKPSTGFQARETLQRYRLMTPAPLTRIALPAPCNRGVFGSDVLPDPACGSVVSSRWAAFVALHKTESGSMRCDRKAVAPPQVQLMLPAGVTKHTP